MKGSERAVLRLKATFKTLVPARAQPSLIRAYAGMRKPLRSARRRRLPPTASRSLANDLRYSGRIEKGRCVMVHSALSQLGNISGGADAVIDAIDAVVGSTGTVLMPTFGNADMVLSGMGTNKVVDLRTERSQTGQLTETFRRAEGTLRSSHPFSSVCARGPEAAYVTRDHHTDPRIAHARSPMGRLLELEGQTIGIGIGLGQVSFYHVVEDTWEDYPLDPYRPPESVTYIDANGQRVSRLVQRYSDRFRSTRIDQPGSGWLREQMGRHLEHEGVLRWFDIGQTRAWIIDTPGLYRELQRLARAGVTIYSTRAGTQGKWPSPNEDADTRLERSGGN